MILTLYEPFRHWSDGGSVYILSDLHFDDEDCKFMSPDWITPEEQLSVINGIVMKNDTFEELEAAKKEVEKVNGEKPISQKMFKAI